MHIFEKISLVSYNSNRAIRSTAKLTYNNISIEFDSDISEAFLATIIKAVCHA